MTGKRTSLARVLMAALIGIALPLAAADSDKPDQAAPPASAPAPTADKTAQPQKTETPPAVPAVPEEMKSQIQSALKEKVDKTLDVKDVCAKLGVHCPPIPVKADPDAVETLIADAVAAAAAKEYPATLDASLETEAREKYPLFAEGDTVTVRYTRGGEVKGRLSQTNPSRVRIGSTWVTRIDLAEESLATIDRTANEQARKKHVLRRTLKLMQAREELARNLRKQFEPEHYTANGYVKWKGNWIPQVPLYEKALDWRRQELAAKIEPDVTRAVLAAAGYLQVGGKWVRLPPSAPKKAEAEITVAATGDNAKVKPDDSKGEETKEIASTDTDTPEDEEEKPAAAKESKTDVWGWSAPAQGTPTATSSPATAATSTTSSASTAATQSPPQTQASPPQTTTQAKEDLGPLQRNLKTTIISVVVFVFTFLITPLRRIRKFWNWVNPTE